MSAWSTGPFDNDRAADYVESLAEMAAAERAVSLASQLTLAIEDPDGARGWLYQEVIAAAAVVAIALGGPGDLLDEEDEVFAETLDSVLPIPVTRELVSVALEAIAVASDPNRDWYRNWLSGEDRRAAVKAVDEVKATLSGFASMS